MGADAALVVAPAVEEVLVRLGQGPVDQRMHRLFELAFVAGVFLLAPDRPELLGCAGRGVEGVVGAHGQQQLRGDKEVGDLVLALVDAELFDAEGHRLFAVVVQVGALALDHGEGDAVDEEHDIGAAGGVAAALLDGELVGDVVDVTFGVLPVDIVEAEALAVAVDRLGEARAQRQQLIDAGVGEQQALEGIVHQAFDRLADIGVAEGMAPALELDLVMRPQPRFQDAGEDDILLLAPAQRQRLVRREVLPAHVDQQLQGGKLGADFF